MGPIRAVIRVLRAIVGRYTTTRRPSSRARVHRSRLHSKYINEFTMRALIPNGLTNRSPSRNALSFRAFALAVVSDTTAHSRLLTSRMQGIARLRRTTLVGSSSRNRMFLCLDPVSRSSVNRHINRGGDAKNSELIEGSESARFNWTDFGDISDILNAN